MLGLTMLHVVDQQCCVRLHGPLMFRLFLAVFSVYNFKRENTKGSMKSIRLNHYL